MTIDESIEILDRLIAKADEYADRYRMERAAHLEVQAHPERTEQEWDWYVEAIKEAHLKARGDV